MARKGVYGASADRLTRLAVQQHDLRHIQQHKETKAPPLMRLALGALAGMFLLAGQASALSAWIGAALFMLAIAGASPGIGAAAGALASAIAWFRMLGPTGGEGVFWLVLPLYAGGGALAGALGSIISKRLPPPLFAFLAALLPAGLEQLGAFGTLADLSSTALTQYAHPFVVRVARFGGLAGVTYIMFLMGGAVAAAVRFIREPDTLVASAAPPAAVAVVALLAGAVGGSSTDTRVNAMAVNYNNLFSDRGELVAAVDYSVEAWTAHITSLCEQAQRNSEKPFAMSTARISSIDDIEAGETGGMQLLVWPEAAVYLNAETRPLLFQRLESMARVTKCAQVASFYDVDTNQSRAVATGTEEGKPVEGYARRRYVHDVDDRFLSWQIAQPGDDRPQVFDTSAGKVGAILSLDANYFANWRSIARGGARLACVLGLDDEEVAQTSVRLLTFNAVKAGLPVLRSTQVGTLMAVTADGEVIAQAQASPQADAALQAALPLGDGSTLFLAVGNAFAWLALLGGIGAGLYASSLPAPPEPGKPRRESGGPITYRSHDGLHRDI